MGHILVLLGRSVPVAHSTKSVPDRDGLNGLVITTGELAESWLHARLFSLKEWK
ncbi:hypothetical protein CEXT_250131, partial [Caerostris extrusa]